MVEPMAEPMADPMTAPSHDTTNADTSSVNPRADHEVRYLSRTLGVDVLTLRDLVRRLAPSVERIMRDLREFRRRD